MKEDIARLERELAQIEQAIAEQEALRGVHPAAKVDARLAELQQKADELRAAIIAIGGNVTDSNLIVGDKNRAIQSDAYIERIEGHVYIQYSSPTEETPPTDEKGEKKALLSNRAPYVGLRTFQEKDAEFFFGREELVKRLLQKVADSPFLAVLGPSGSGKSSVVLAGLLPALRQGSLPSSERWRYVMIRPGPSPLRTLAVALAKLQRGDQLGQVSEMRRLFAKDSQVLLDAVALLCEPETRFVLVVDQFEELWTQAPTEPETRKAFIEQEQRPFISLLLTAASAPESPMLVILTMRADFLHRAAENRDLAHQIGEHDVIVSPMQPDELRQVIEKPAHNAGGDFEPGLVDELIEQVEKRPGALPLIDIHYLNYGSPSVLMEQCLGKLSATSVG